MEKLDILKELIPTDKEVIELAMLITDSRDPNELTNVVAIVDLIFNRMKKKAGMDSPSEPKIFNAKDNIVYFRSEIETLQNEVHSITGDGEAMQCFNKFLGNESI